MEKFTLLATNFTLPPGLTGWTNFTSGHLVHIGFWSGIGQNVQKMAYLAQNDQKCIFWTNFGRFWAKNPNFYGSK